MVKITKLKSLSGLIGYQLMKLTAHYKSRGELHQYWMNPRDGSNLPSNYLQPAGGERRSSFLCELIDSYTINKDNTILEIGCNVGRNLNYLFNAGYKKLSGVEISQDAIDMMKQVYPEMFNKSNICCSSIEDIIKNFEDNTFTVVFTMAALQHIHPTAKFIFYEMVRITSKYIITIGDEKEISWRHYPRNYKKIFESLGMKQIYQINCKTEGLNSNFWARVFVK